jgi:hypothetical protein
MPMWINEGSRFVWDASYSSWARAATRSQELAKQYNIFTETAQTEEQKYVVMTYNDIGDEPHSVACRCEKCSE